MVTALTIAGSDSGGGAGIQADLKTFAAHGVYGTCAITALTAQNTTAVTGVVAVAPGFVTAQIDAVASDIAIGAAKTGMLPTAAVVDAVADALARWAFPHVVVDPVMVAKSGDALLDAAAAERIRTALLPRASVVTPNRPEAEVLTGHRIITAMDVRDAARRLVGLGAKAAVIKGGHFDGPEVIDLLFDGSEFHEYRHPRQQTRHTHGTGCTFAAALAANLALGNALTDALARTTDYVAGAIAHGLAIGRGHGPLDHFYRLTPNLRGRQPPSHREHKDGTEF
jgi:hydroxymethylpyrimidine/phosphomethylpyrimidine kinase